MPSDRSPAAPAAPLDINPMLTPEPQSADGRRLLRLFRRLGAADRSTLLAFGEFLASRGEAAVAELAPIAVPMPEPRPEQETVVGAIKRLRRVYPMLDGATILTQTSDLMTAHVLYGRPAAAIIDDLEALFARRYAALASGEAAPEPDVPE